MIDRVRTGIENLDFLLKGGFPRGSLIVLAGNPGSGKTILGGQFLYAGATKYNEPGVYVSFAEGRSILIEFMKAFGFDFGKLETQGKVRIMDLVAMKEAGLSAAMENVLGAIMSMKAKRLVIDSFSAIASAFREKADVRVMLHTILSKMVRQLDCTTILITEISWGKQSIGEGIEEFVADGVIMIDSFIENFEMKRRMIILKMRGTEHSTKYHDVSVSANGISIVPVPTMK